MKTVHTTCDTCDKSLDDEIENIQVIRSLGTPKDFCNLNCLKRWYFTTDILTEEIIPNGLE